MTTTGTNNSVEELKQAIRSCPIIDNHGHNLLRPHGLKTGNLLTITTEASGDALEDAPTSLAHLRAVKQLRKLYDLDEDADCERILKKRAEILESDPDGLTKKCLQGTQTILIDDGLASGDTIEPIRWHDTFTMSPCKRVVRIEAIAAEILSSLHQQNQLPVGVAIADEEACSLAWLSFISAFEQAIVGYISDPDVVGFKSVVCYRTGLDVKVGKDADVTEDGLRSFRRHFLPEAVARKFRVEAKGMCDALVISTCKLIAAGNRQHGIAKPFQFHTGLGDNDISLLDSNPGCLQPLIAAFPTVPVVLLHASYPYTREAGYLATVYKNCYLDIGEVFPMISRDGQEKVIRQALELTPWGKLLWSTDGHFFPETYWLANVQGREAIEKVFCQYVELGDLTVKQAVKAVQDIFFANSNLLYGLKLKPQEETNALPERIEDEQPIDQKDEKPTSACIMAPASKIDQPTLQANSRYLSSFESVYVPFLDAHPNTKFVFVQWLDYLGQMRTRCLPIPEFQKLLKTGKVFQISTGNLGTLQNDAFSSVCNPVGSICVEPDLSLASLRPMQNLGPVKDAASVMASFTDEEGIGLDLCPRASLQWIAEAFAKEYAVDMLVGFEIEITFCKRNSHASHDAFSPLESIGHAWATFNDRQYTTSFGLMMEITNALQNIGIEVQQLHSEAGAGQYEFVLPPLPPILATDTLIQARQCIMQIAATHDLRATCHPMPFPGIGTAAHAHISFNSRSASDADLESVSQSFAASLLAHLPALCALTMPQAVSYGRVVDDSWTGGTWVAWGTQNREVPLRKSGERRWEIRCLDGCANMYLALAAILAVGLSGVREGIKLTMQDCHSNPTKLSNQEKADLGIMDKLPTSLNEALEAAQNDTVLEQAMSPGMLKHHLTMKKAEQEMLNEMSEAERRVWLMERY